MKLQKMLFAALFAALLAVSGMISIPMVPVPITFQTFVVMIAGSVLGARWGMMSMFIFLLLVATGAPLLQGGVGGLGALMGPTGGFVFSWPIAAGLIGLAVQYSMKQGEIAAWRLATYHLVGGMIVVYLIGIPWMLWVTGLSFPNVFYSAFVVFIPGGLIKTWLATMTTLAVYRAYPTIKPASMRPS